MAESTVLVIEDDHDIRELIRHHLARDGYRVEEAADGPGGLSKARSGAFDLVLLDLMLPGMTGLEVCKSLKSDPQTAGIPVVMVTAKGEEADIVVGLELGADDYVIKPFSPKVLLARVRAVIRRRSRPLEGAPGAILRLDRLEINEGKREVLVDGKPVDLTYSEFQILHFLAQRPGWVFTRYQIVDAVKGEAYPVTDRAVDVQIVGLRRKLGSAGKLIETVRSVGYRFADPASSIAE
jgi:two-component system, OmpR family, alkaline phosphatase synthesis response regulator PhoP